LTGVETGVVYNEESQNTCARKPSPKAPEVVQLELALRFASYGLIVVFGVILVALSLVSMWKENHFGWPLRGIIWFSLAIIGSCTIIALLAGYEQTARSLEKVSRRVQAVTFGVD
jgi:hypothetical protein